jgi:hypothetical protein
MGKKISLRDLGRELARRSEGAREDYEAIGLGLDGQPRELTRERMKETVDPSKGEITESDSE